MIPLNDLSREITYPIIKDKINSIFDRGHFLNGPELKNFETKFSDYIDRDFVGLGNGTDALEIALRCLNIRPLDRVLLAPNCGMYATLCILGCGAIPVYGDVDPDTLLLNDIIECDAVIITHLYGQMDEKSVTLAQNYNIPIVEDCAHSQKMLDDLGTFSFYPTKNLGATGNGGGIGGKYAEKARQLGCYGWSDKYYVDITHGIHSQMDEIQAAALSVKLNFLEEANERRKKIRDYYRSSTDINFVGAGYIPHLCVIRVNNRDSVRQKLLDKGIMTDIHYPVLDYQQKTMNKKVSCPNAERVVKEILTIPCFPEMTDTEVEYVAQALRSL